MKIDLTEIPAYYINLPNHKEKNDNIKNMLSDLGFKYVQRLDGIAYPENPVAGCSRAHYHALNLCTPPFILFEDDAFLLTQNWNPIIEIPNDADALYLGNSTWGRMNGHDGEYIQYDILFEYPNVLRIYNMMSGHAILYLTEEYKNLIKRVAHHAGYVIENYNDVEFAEVQRYFNVYALDYPMFAQTSNLQGTNKSITSINHTECMNPNPLQFYPYKIK
jgi:hypothetical protein